MSTDFQLLVVPSLRGRRDPSGVPDMARNAAAAERNPQASALMSRGVIFNQRRGFLSLFCEDGKTLRTD